MSMAMTRRMPLAVRRSTRALKMFLRHWRAVRHARIPNVVAGALVVHIPRDASAIGNYCRGIAIS